MELKKWNILTNEGKINNKSENIFIIIFLMIINVFSSPLIQLQKVSIWKIIKIGGEIIIQ